MPHRCGPNADESLRRRWAAVRCGRYCCCRCPRSPMRSWTHPQRHWWRWSRTTRTENSRRLNSGFRRAIGRFRRPMRVDVLSGSKYGRGRAFACSSSICCLRFRGGLASRCAWRRRSRIKGWANKRKGGMLKKKRKYDIHWKWKYTIRRKHCDKWSCFIIEKTICYNRMAIRMTQHILLIVIEDIN